MQVNHSQRMNEKPLVPWIIAEVEGKIIAANCDCMAGLGETCSHVASLLWVTATGVEKRDSLTVTQKSAYWIMPPAIKTVPHAPLAEISFVGKKRKNAIITKDTPVDTPICPKERQELVHHRTQRRQNFFIPWLNVKELCLQCLLLYLHTMKPIFLYL